MGMEGVQYQCNGSGPGYPLHNGLAVLFRPLAKQIAFQVQLASDVPLNTVVVNEALLRVNGQLQVPLTATTWINRIDLSNSSLAVDKTEARAGEKLVYSILLRNSGNVAASDVSLIDPIPLGTSYVAGSATRGATYNQLENRIEWHGSVSPQGSIPISFTVATSPTARHNTLVTNTASFDDGLGNVITKSVVTVLKAYDLSASVKVMPATTHPGDAILCTIRLRNTGAISTSAVLTDVVPSGATLVPASLWWSSGEGSMDLGTVTWRGEIIAQGMVIVRFLMRVGLDVEPGASLSNTAFIQDQAGNIYLHSASTIVYPHTLCLPIIISNKASITQK